ncbi:MAG: hypothetical protein U0324_23845 [Polyangiales bacterium]
MSEADVTPTPPRHVFRWDLDKTYLHTDFDTWIDLVRTAVEKPEGKRTVAGAGALLRELRASVPSLLTIVSGSPEQMRNTLEAKLRLDGIRWDEFVLKPSLQNMLRLRFRALRDQVGYKLPALLSARSRTPAHLPETLFGDDAEADALVYTLYADIVAGRIDDKRLTAVMEHANAYPDAIGEVIRLAHQVDRADPVKRIFIHLERKSDPGFFRRYGPRVVPIFNYFQAALVLARDAVLPADAAVRVAEVLVRDAGVAVDDLGRSAADLAARGHLAPGDLNPVADAVTAGAPTAALGEPARAALAAALRDLPPIEGDGAVTSEAPIDHLAALFEDRARWEGASRDAKAAKKAKRKARRGGGGGGDAGGG